MYKKVLCPVAVLLLILIAAPAYAAGIGLFFNSAKIESDWDGDSNIDNSNGLHQDYGFAIDSNLATDRLFNYRMELGRTNWGIDSFNDQGVKADLDGLVMNHDFGFGGLITPNLRLWFGPELRVTLLEGELDGVTARDIDLIGLGYGAALGLNVNLPGRLTLAAKGGLLRMGYHGRGPNWNGSSWQGSDYDVDEDLVYVGISMFFRTLSNR